MALYRRGPVWWMRLSFKGRQIRRSTDATDKKLVEKIYHMVRVQLAEGRWFPPDAWVGKTVRDLLERYRTFLGLRRATRKRVLAVFGP